MYCLTVIYIKKILTDSIKDCPINMPNGFKLYEVSNKSIRDYSDDKNVEVVICTRGLVRLLKNFNFPGLKLVQLFSVGYDELDLNWFRNKGITLCNGGGYTTVY